MRRILPVLLALGVVLSAGQLQWVSGRFLVHFQPDPLMQFSRTADGAFACGIPAIDQIMAEYPITKVKRLMPLPTNPRIKQLRHHIQNLFVIYADVDSMEIPEICARFKQLPEVLDAYPDYVFKEMAIPNDEHYSSQWHHEKINMPDVWEFITDANDVLVTVLEGVEWYHPDLYDNIWVNPGEDLDGDGVPMDPDDLNGIDDDGNGYVDDLIGWDFVDDDNDPDDQSSGYATGHGTMCSGIIAEVGNNRIGGSGIVWHTKIVCLRSDQDSAHVTSAIIAAMQYGIENNIDIYNLSYGGYSHSPAAPYYQAAYNLTNAVLIAAAGNENTSEISYPAGYSYILAVGATNRYDQRTWFSNYGTWVDLMAPGEHIYCTTVDSSYESPDGTSMAAPVVAGVAALLRQQFPDSSNEFIYEKLREGTDNIDSLNPGYEGLLGTGRINAAKALFQWRFPFITIDSFRVVDSDGDGRVIASEEAQLYLYFHNEEGWQTGEDLSINVFTSDTFVEFIDHTASLGDIPPGGTANIDSDPIRFRVADADFEGHTAKFGIRITSGTSDYRKSIYISVKIGYSPILVYDCDAEHSYSDFLANTLEAGKTNFDVWRRRERGELLDESLADRYFRVIFVCGGDDSTQILSDEEINFLENFMDNGGNVVLTSQYYPDKLAITHPEFLENYFGATHDEDAITRMWGLYIDGIDGDPISDGMVLKGITSSDAANNQVSFGTAVPTGGGVGFLRYRSDTVSTRFAAIRNQLSSGAKTILMEFGIEGICNGVPGFTSRDSLVAKILRWMGEEYTFIDEPQKDSHPSKLDIKAYPNPFNSSVTISFNADGAYSGDIYDFSGKLIAHLGDGSAVGRVTLSWNGRDNRGIEAPAGMYLVKIHSLNRDEVYKIVYVK